MTTCRPCARSGQQLWFLGDIGAGFSDGGGGYTGRGCVDNKSSTSVVAIFWSFGT